MRVLSSDIICGIEAKILRNFFKEFKFFKTKEFLEIGNNLNLKCLLKNGFIHKLKKNWDYGTTIKGNALSSAKFIKPISRNKADQLIREIIERAKEINSNDYYISNVESIHAFGSYITKRKDVGDLDLILKLSKKDGITNDDVIRIGYERSGHINSNMAFHMFYASDYEPKKYLKKRSPYINFHEKDEVTKQLKTRFKLIWKRN